MIGNIAFTAALFVISAVAIYFPLRRAKAKRCFTGYVLVFIAGLLCSIGILGWLEMIVRDVYPTFIPFAAIAAGWFVAGISHLGSIVWSKQMEANQASQPTPPKRRG